MYEKWCILKYWIKYTVLGYPRQIYYGLQNLWQYKVIVWKDRDWDYGFLLRILQFKLRRMQIHLSKYSYEERKSLARKVDHIEECVEILERLLEDDYCKKEWDAYYNEYPYLAGDLNWNKPMSKPQSKLFMSIFAKEQALEKKDWNRLFYILRRYMKGWWE